MAQPNTAEPIRKVIAKLLDELDRASKSHKRESTKHRRIARGMKRSRAKLVEELREELGKFGISLQVDADGEDEEE